MKNNRLVVEVITQLIQRLDTLEGKQNQVDDGLSDVDKQVKRLAKELYKSNLANGSSDNQDIQDLLQQLHEDYAKRQEDAVKQARLEIMKSFLPVVDVVEAGLRNGTKQLKRLRQTNPEAAQTLYAWLSGQRLVRERLLKLLESENIRPMKALGQTFDPYRHVAIKVVSVADKASGTIVQIERSGYVHSEHVLRFADVIVNKSN